MLRILLLFALILFLAGLYRKWLYGKPSSSGQEERGSQKKNPTKDDGLGDAEDADYKEVR